MSNVEKRSPNATNALAPAEKRQDVQFFCSEATGILSGFFPSDCWDRFLSQLTHQHPTIRHAAAAVGAAYEQYALRAPGEKTTENFALQQYSKAIQSFREQIQNPHDQNIDLILITCALFTCLEVLHSNSNRAMDHVEGGVQILLSRLKCASIQPPK
ncbi:hypothetical protein N7532_003603 [Penicillium argentinense]|uniref:Uncharacterized protein n=1 Tax=Penicillium argentinense TaxID=1131581 RepID=A0A9W9FMP5_9EURO|nr:uncharacterized protein N7532_003603 [Penicillium argentinense]KAJ5103074.1 hypothetical protein N7532_003603 [Penicillium argentinense]